MKKGLRITLAAAAACLIVLVYLVIHGLNERRIGQLTCAGVRVEFADNLTFVTAKDVEGYLSKGTGTTWGSVWTAWIWRKSRMSLKARARF